MGRCRASAADVENIAAELRKKVTSALVYFVLDTAMKNLRTAAFWVLSSFWMGGGRRARGLRAQGWPSYEHSS